MSAASEAEVGTLFINCKESVVLRNIMEEMEHPQPPIPVETDDSTVCGIANAKIQQK